MKITVMNRKMASELTPGVNHSLISISTPKKVYDENVPTFGWRHVSLLQFHDLLPETCQELGGVYEGKPLVLFNHHMAKAIINFIDYLIGVVKRDHGLIIHCDAGVSRSVAVGAFLKDFYGFNVEFTVTGTSESRNQHVYNVLRRVKQGIEPDVSVDDIDVEVVLPDITNKEDE